MFSDQKMLDVLNSLQLPSTKDEVRFDPPTDKATPDQSPSMYFNAHPGAYTYCAYSHVFLSIDVDGLGYQYVRWNRNNTFALSIIDIDGMFSEETKNLRDTIRTGTFHASEEEHFQEECLEGAPISWELEVAINAKLDALAELYNKFRYEEVQ